jgi:hypothetical protein
LAQLTPGYSIRDIKRLSDEVVLSQLVRKEQTRIEQHSSSTQQSTSKLKDKQGNETESDVQWTDVQQALLRTRPLQKEGFGVLSNSAGFEAIGGYSSIKSRFVFSFELFSEILTLCSFFLSSLLTSLSIVSLRLELVVKQWANSLHSKSKLNVVPSGIFLSPSSPLSPLFLFFSFHL